MYYFCLFLLLFMTIWVIIAYYVAKTRKKHKDGKDRGAYSQFGDLAR